MIACYYVYPDEFRYFIVSASGKRMLLSCYFGFNGGRVSMGFSSNFKIGPLFVDKELLGIMDFL